jgi:hypothetical protein
MKESEWLASDSPNEMLWQVRERMSRRKQVLFVLARYRLSAPPMDHEWLARAEQMVAMRSGRPQGLPLVGHIVPRCRPDRQGLRRVSPRKLGV